MTQSHCNELLLQKKVIAELLTENLHDTYSFEEYYEEPDDDRDNPGEDDDYHSISDIPDDDLPF